jgi:hypothetical protein
MAGNPHELDVAVMSNPERRQPGPPGQHGQHGGDLADLDLAIVRGLAADGRCASPTSLSGSGCRSWRFSSGCGDVSYLLDQEDDRAVHAVGGSPILCLTRHGGCPSLPNSRRPWPRLGRVGPSAAIGRGFRG